MNSIELKEKRLKLGLTQEELAEKLGVSARTIINYEQGGVIPKSKNALFQAVFNSLLSNISHNKSEILDIDEVKVNSPHNYDYYENKHDNKFVALPNGQYYMLMPLAEVSVQAGLLDNFKDVDYLADLPQHGIIVDKPAQGRYVAFRVSGDSMEDGTDGSIKYNSIVSTRELQRHHWVSKLRIKDFPFWVIYTTQSKMPLLKQITEHNTEEGYIVCHSLNDSPQYSDFKLNIDDIQALFYVIDYNLGLSKKTVY